MKVKKFIATLLLITIMFSLLPTHIFAASTVKLTITPNVTEAHPGDEITYTVKMSAVQNLAGLGFKLDIPEGLTFIEGAAVDGLAELFNAALAEFTTSTKKFVTGSGCNYSSDADTTIMTFKCSVNEGVTGDKEVAFIMEEDDIFDTSYDNIPVDYSNPGSKVKITIPSIMPTTVILFLMSVGGIFKGNFDMFYNLVGNNGLLYNYTDVIDTLTFRALISNSDYGMSSAMGLYLSVLCFATVLIANKLVGMYEKDYTLF